MSYATPMRVLTLLLLLPTLLAAELATLESLTAQWIALRAERADEQRAWADESARLQLELRLLQDAGSHLNEELAALQSQASDAESDQTDLLRELEAHQQSRETLRTALAETAPRLETRLNALPPSRLPELREDRDALDAAGSELLPRIRALLSLHNRLLQLQTSLFAHNDVIDLPGGRREMNILWLGTARAYAVNADRTHAATGSLTPDGWQWTPAPELAPRIAAALRLFNQKAPPALITLPVEGPQ